jgi:hypothetical protein
VRRIKEVLRLKFEVALGLRQIARSCLNALGTVHEYLQRAEGARITWPLGPDLRRQPAQSCIVRRTAGSPNGVADAGLC